MATELATKTAYYFRARRNDTPFDLQSMIARARKRKKTVGDSEVELGGGDVVRIQHYKSTGGHIFLHLARYVPGVVASTLLPKAVAEEEDEGSQAAPKGKEFKDGDCFLLVNGFHVLYCGHGISLPKTSLYLSKLFNEAKLHDDSSGFDLTPASNLNKLNMIKEHGVRSVQLATNAFDMSLPKVRRKKWASKMLGTIGDELKSLVKKDKSTIEQKALEDLLVNVEVRLDGNTRAAASAQKFIGEIAEGILDEKDAPISDFAIVTQKNERITSSDIRLQTVIYVERKDNSVSHNSAWSQLSGYFDEIRSGNLLEQ